MRNILENIAVILVVIFSLTILGLIVQYNLIEEEKEMHFNYTSPTEKSLSSVQENSGYLDNMERYKDIDVKVDPRKEDTSNRIKVKSEIRDDKIEAIVQENRTDTIGNALDKLLN